MESADLESAADREWIEQWRTCVLDRAWQKLDFTQQKSDGNLGYTVLRLTVDQRQADSATLAEQVSQLSGCPCTAAAFRKQLSRARHQFAKAIITELRHALTTPTREALEQELIGLNLLSYVRDYIAE